MHAARPPIISKMPRRTATKPGSLPEYIFEVSIKKPKMIVTADNAICFARKLAFRAAAPLCKRASVVAAFNLQLSEQTNPDSALVAQDAHKGTEHIRHNDKARDS